MGTRQMLKLKQQMDEFAQSEIVEKKLTGAFDPWYYRDMVEAQAPRTCYITIVAVPAALMPRGVSGVVINVTEDGGPDEYVILYSADAQGVLLWRILFHELGHIVLFHVSEPGSFIALRKHTLQGNITLSKPEEAEAEFFSSSMSMYATFGVPRTMTDAASRRLRSIDGFMGRLSWKRT